MSKHRCSVVSFEACLAVGRRLPWAEGPLMYSSPAVGEMEPSAGFFACSHCPPGAVECHGESAPGCVCTEGRRPLPSRSSEPVVTAHSCPSRVAPLANCTHPSCLVLGQGTSRVPVKRSGARRGWGMCGG